jgi:hypothetical protein
MHARSTDECTLATRADGLDGNGSGSAGCGAYVVGRCRLTLSIPS